MLSYIKLIMLFYVCFKKKITLQGTTNDIAPFLYKRQDQGNLIQLVQKSELQAVMENNKTLLEPIVQLVYHAYQVTSANIKYINDNLKPVCYMSSKSKVSSTVDAQATGMSFHTSLRAKAGLVIYTTFKVSTFSDFDMHLKARLKYITQKLVTSMDENFHIMVSFPIHIRFGEILQTAFKCGLKPGIRDEGILVVHRSTKTYEPAKL